MKQKRNGYITNRTVYKAVKKYDHAQFDSFCTKIYEEGYRDGAAATPGVDLSQIMHQIGQIKGIGQKRLGQIQESVSVLFGQQSGGEGNA